MASPRSRSTSQHIPLDKVLKLYLVTAYGETLGIDRERAIPSADGDLHLYQEIAPVQPLVVSTLGPQSFYDFLTQDPNSMIHLPAIAYQSGVEITAAGKSDALLADG